MISINSVNFKGISPKSQAQLKREANNGEEVKHTPLPNTEFLSCYKQRLCALPQNSEAKKTAEMSFSEWADKTDFVKALMPSILLNADKYKIGSGFSHTTYKIPGNDNYILRTINSTNIRDLDLFSGTMMDTEDKNLKINIGQKVADIMFKTNSGLPVFMEVLKKQEGTPIGVTNPRTLYNEYTGELREGAVPYEAPERKEQYSASLKKLANMPLRTYEKLINDIKTASEAGYTFDHYNSNNLLLDEKKERINLIDMEPSKVDVNYGNVLYALTNIQYFPTYASKTDSNPTPKHDVEKAIENTIAITQKFMLAMKTQNVKFSGANSSVEFNEFLRSYPIARYIGEYSSSKAYEYFKSHGVG